MRECATAASQLHKAISMVIAHTRTDGTIEWVTRSIGKLLRRCSACKGENDAEETLNDRGLYDNELKNMI